jgi:hypothetical protein
MQMRVVQSGASKNIKWRDCPLHLPSDISSTIQSSTRKSLLYQKENIKMSLISLPREIRDSTYNPLSFPATKPTPDFPVIMATVIVNDQPFHINSVLSKHEIVSRSGAGVHQSCRQIHAEYSQLLRRAAFTPGTKTVAPVFNFDFREMIAFVKTLKAHEIVAANRNRNLVVNLLMFDVKALETQRLLEWVRLCETIGIQVSYVLQWTAYDVNQFKDVYAGIGEYREGKKILKAVAGKSIKGWSWERHVSDLKQRD